MVSRYHWVTLQNSGGVPNGSGGQLMNQTASIPAHATLKKVLVDNCFFLGKQEGTDNKGLNAWGITIEIRIIGGVNNNRIVYETARAIPMMMGVLSATVINFYTAFYSAGDNEMGVNHSCSYGKATDATAYGVRFLINTNCLLATQNQNWGIGLSKYSVQAKALYYL